MHVHVHCLASSPLLFSSSFGVGQQHQKCFNRALMGLAPNLTPNTHVKRTRSSPRAHCGLKIAGWWWEVLNRKSEREELVVPMEEDAPSFSHPYLPSSSLLPPESPPSLCGPNLSLTSLILLFTAVQEQILSLEPLCTLSLVLSRQQKGFFFDLLGFLGFFFPDC